MSKELDVAMENKGKEKCQPFSIRGYVAEMKEKDEKICSLFVTVDGDGDGDEDNDQISRHETQENEKPIVFSRRKGQKVRLLSDLLCQKTGPKGKGKMTIANNVRAGICLETGLKITWNEHVTKKRSNLRRKRNNKQQQLQPNSTQNSDAEKFAVAVTVVAAFVVATVVSFLASAIRTVFASRNVLEPSISEASIPKSTSSVNQGEKANVNGYEKKLLDLNEGFDENNIYNMHEELEISGPSSNEKSVEAEEDSEATVVKQNDDNNKAVFGHGNSSEKRKKKIMDFDLNDSNPNEDEDEDEEQFFFKPIGTEMKKNGFPMVMTPLMDPSSSKTQMGFAMDVAEKSFEKPLLVGRSFSPFEPCAEKLPPMEDGILNSSTFSRHPSSAFSDFKQAAPPPPPPPAEKIIYYSRTRAPKSHLVSAASAAATHPLPANKTVTVLPWEIRSGNQICTVNRNPAEFVNGEEENEYMICGEDLKIGKKTKKNRRKRGSESAGGGAGAGGRKKKKE